MKVLRLHGSGDLRLHEETEPVAGRDKLKIRVTAVGLCGSDLQWFTQSAIGDAQLAAPLVLGHEFAGVIESGPRGGQRVAVDPAIPCHRCRYCLEGNPNLCENLHFAGHGAYDGALQEKILWPSAYLHPLPDVINDMEGAMLEPLGVAIYALDLGHVKPGMTVGVFGCGPIGLLLIQLVRAAGATRIIATDKLVHRLEAASSYGADAVIRATDGEEHKKVLAATKKKGVDIAFEAAGANAAVQTAINVVRPGREVVIIGIPENDRTEFTASTARRKGLTLKIVRRMKYTYPRAIHLVSKGVVDVKSLVTHRYPLTEFKKAFTAARKREGLKVVIEL